MKKWTGLVWLLVFALQVSAADSLTDTLQRGLLEEEANRDLDAAIKAYDAVITRADEERKIVATAVFRLAECYRKLGRTNEAHAQYQRVLRDFSDQDALVALSRSLLPGEQATPKGSMTLAEKIEERKANEERESLAHWREQVRDNPDLVNKTELGPPLHTAIEKGQLSIVQFLLDNRADLNGRNGVKQTPLHVAVATNRREPLDLLLQRGADVNARDNSQRTPLHLAAISGYLAIAQTLIDAKADLNLLDTQKETPLMIAVSRGYRAMTELLLSRGADPNKAAVFANEIFHKTSLSIAVVADNLHLVSMLLSNKADPEARVILNRTTTPLGYAAANDSVEVMKLLLDAGANPSHPNGSGQTPLMLAAASGANSSVKLLLDRGVNPREADANGSTALHVAAINGYIDPIQMLIERGVPVNVRTKAGHTPLSLAVAYWRVAATKALLAAGAEPDVLVPDWGTPLSVAQGAAQRTGLVLESQRENAAAIVQLLLAAGANPLRERQSTISIGYRTNALRTIFTRGTNDWNRYTLLEALRGNANAFPWADWTNAYIERVVDRSLTNVPMNLAAIFASGQCSNDVWLEWGDRLILPELDHPLNAAAPRLPDGAAKLFDECLKRTVRIVVKQETNEFHLNYRSDAPVVAAAPIPRPASGTATVNKDGNRTLSTSFRLRDVVYGVGVLRASSDPTRVRVTRIEPNGGTNVWQVNVTTVAAPNESNSAKSSNAHDLWLRDGDLIVIPDKP